MKKSVVVEDLDQPALQDKTCARQRLLLLVTLEAVHGVVFEISRPVCIFVTKQGVHSQSRHVMPLQPALHDPPPPLSSPQSLAGYSIPHRNQPPVQHAIATSVLVPSIFWPCCYQ